MSLEPVADGELAAVVTYLEMTQPPPIAADGTQTPLRLVRIAPGLAEYRRLFQKVGARWLWFSRLAMPDPKLEQILSDPKVHFYSVASPHEDELGLLELDFREPGECELAFVGLVPDLAGRGHGRWLLAEAVRRAWAPGVRRVHVHTCSLDHPAALAAYRRAGFTPHKRAIERFADPRRLGILPRDCAPQVPLLGTDASTPAAPPAS